MHGLDAEVIHFYVDASGYGGGMVVTQLGTPIKAFCATEAEQGSILALLASQSKRILSKFLLSTIPSASM